MTNYKIISNVPGANVFGDKVVMEKVLKCLNIGKEISIKLGSEYNPPYIWNENMPTKFVRVIAKKIADKIEENINYKPTEEFIEELRQDFKNCLK